MDQEDFLYIQLADRIEKQIYNQVLKTGDKLISVRTLSKEQHISLSTAYKAYAELENRGLIEARPKSGYYVRFAKHRFPQAPASSNPDMERGEVAVDDMISIVYQNLSDDNIIKLSLAAPALSLIPQARLTKSMVSALRQSPNSCTGYEQVQGNQLLRKQIAKYAFNWGGNITEDDIVTTQGCMEALVFCLKAVTEPGDTVAIESPTYFGIFNVMKGLGLKVLEIPTNDKTGIDLGYLEKALTKTRIKACLFVPTFSNPTGACMSDQYKEKLVELLAEKEIPLIEDDIYGEMFFGIQRPRTCKSFDRRGLVMLCSSVSKMLAPGYRIGWCIPGKFKTEIIKQKLIHTVSSASPTQAAMGHFFENGRYDLHMRKLRKALYTQSLRYLQAITDYFPEGTKVSHPQGGYVLWVEMDKKINAFHLFQKAIKHQISIAPGQIFSTDGRFSNFMRISFGIPFDQQMDESLKLLGRLVTEEL